MTGLRSKILVLVLGLAAPAFAYEDSPADEPGTETMASDPALATGPIQPFVPPAIDYPGVIDLGPKLALYIDHTYEYTNDLSTFWWVRGRGNNYRVAFGGVYAFGNLRVHAEVPLQYTRLAIDSLMGKQPTDADRTKAALSLADLITDAAYFWNLSIGAMPTHVGLGMRIRWPTHTTKYSFGLVTGSTVEFGFPYYLHLAPAALVSTSYGPVFLVANQGLLAMLAKDVNIGGVIQPIPNIYFWESHVALGLAATDWLAFTVELLSFVQLNRAVLIDPTTSTQDSLIDTRAVFLNPGVTLDIGNFRLAAAGRLDLTGKSTRDFGVITFSGSRALLARLSYLY